jgi:glycosyltransferase 2 family protein
LRISLKDWIWPAVGLAAVAFSIWLLYHEVRGISVGDVLDGLASITAERWVLATGGAVVAYAALAGYDHIALRHLGRRVPLHFITLCSFTTYALSHNIGASVLSGAVVRYRAYRTQGLSAGEVGVLVALCSFTFALGTLILGGIVLIIEPELPTRFVDVLPLEAGATTGAVLLFFVALYVFGSWLQLKPITLGGFAIFYPRLPVVARQLVIGPIELVGAAAIIHFALPEAGHPGFVVVAGIFVASFSLALLSHAPGGIGVLELVFVAGLSEMDPADVLAALLVFRLLYLVIPFVIAIVVVVVFERRQIGQMLGRRREGATTPLQERGGQERRSKA